MTDPTTGSLRVNGATLHYEVRCQGPLLLLIPGGAGGAASFDGIADDLAAERTVATYDPRGMSRSTLHDPEAEQQVVEQQVVEHADDAYRLLELLSPRQPARVFGASSGAIAALHLLTAHPERVERVVAHEPPVVEVLPGVREHRALLARVQETFRASGDGAVCLLPQTTPRQATPRASAARMRGRGRCGRVGRHLPHQASTRDGKPPT